MREKVRIRDTVSESARHSQRVSDLVSFLGVAKNLLARLSEVSAVKGMNCSTLMFGSPGEQYTTLIGQIQYAWKALMAASGLEHKQS